jgi:MoaA/NifB/PqqE/SkfB family radical SAM enzyme
MSKVDLKNYFCLHPFIYTEFHRDWSTGKPKETQFLCCPDWNNVDIHVSDNLMDNWNSDAAKKVREGHLSGNFVGCSPINCPSFNTLLNTGEAAGSIRPISEYNEENFKQKGPVRIKVCSDDACNFRCPTCRTELYPNTPEKTDRTNKLLNNIKEYYGPTLKEIYLSGGGDPFYSIPIRNFLTDLKTEDFPVIESVILHTNGSLWTEKLWSQMTNIHPYVKDCEISIDAATKDTYENKTRLGGKWDVLMANLEFIKNIQTIERIWFSFVVQQNNYKEMEAFILLIDHLFKDSKIKTIIQLQKVTQWPSISDQRYAEMKIWEPTNPEYNDFLIELAKIKKYDNIFHNLNEHSEKPLI